jgi:hypothetical protein
VLDFLLEQANVFGAEVKRERLVSLLENGGCFLLFDGLDEVSPSDIKRLDYKLRPFFAKYATNSFVVTTRPYPIHKLSSLVVFDVMDLQPLRYEQAVELVRKREKLFTNTSNSTKLSDDLTLQLFQKHEGIMRNPKLLTVMLITYGRLRLIPDKFHVLYREVIKSLSELYDEERNNENRMLKTRLTVREVLRLLSALCYRAYENGEYDFTEQTFDRYLRQADNEIDTENFLFDLCENLCFLEASGGKFRFYHRSMQEYFCAQHLSQLPPEQWSSFNALLRTRPQDPNESVLSLLYEINPESVEKHIFLPFLTELFGKSQKHTGYASYLFSQYPLIYYDHEEPLEESVNQPSVPLLQFLRVMLDAPYKYSPSDIPFYAEFAVWVTLMPIFTFGNDEENEYESNAAGFINAVVLDADDYEPISDKADEIMVPKRIPYFSYDPDAGNIVSEEAGYELEFSPQEVYAAYENDGKYEALIKTLDNDEFEFKAEYLALFGYYEELKSRVAL